MRSLPWLSLLLITGCEEQPARDTPGGAKQADQIECSIGGEPFQRGCAIDRSAGDASILTIRHPDGGFRRLQVSGDGRDMIAADGAAPASIKDSADGRVEVAIDGDRYRLPVAITGR